MNDQNTSPCIECQFKKNINEIVIKRFINSPREKLEEKIQI